MQQPHPSDVLALDRTWFPKNVKDVDDFPLTLAQKDAGAGVYAKVTEALFRSVVAETRDAIGRPVPTFRVWPENW